MKYKFPLSYSGFLWVSGERRWSFELQNEQPSESEIPVEWNGALNQLFCSIHCIN